MYRQHSRDINSVEVLDYVELVEEHLPEGTVFMASSVVPYQFVSEQVDFFYTTEKIGTDFIEKIENRRFPISGNQLGGFDVPEFLKN